MWENKIIYIYPIRYFNQQLALKYCITFFFNSRCRRNSVHMQDLTDGVNLLEYKILNSKLKNMLNSGFLSHLISEEYTT